VIDNDEQVAVPRSHADTAPNENQHLEDITGATRPQGPWHAETLADAIWAIRRLRHLAAQERAVTEAAAAELARVTAWRDAQVAHLARDRAFFEGELVAYHARQLAADPRTPATLALPGGRIQRRRLPDALDLPDEAAALDALRAAGWTDAIRVRPAEEHVDRRAALARIQATGETLPGVRLREVRYTHTVVLDASPVQKERKEDDSHGGDA